MKNILNIYKYLIIFSTLDGFIADTITLVSRINEDPYCSLSIMDNDFFKNIPLGFMFRKGWPWAEELKFEELRMNEIKRNEDLWKMKGRQMCEAPLEEHSQLSIVDMRGMFFILVFAVTYCGFCLMVENIHSFLVYRYRHLNGRWNVPHA